jgi:hypothetical protein
MVWDPGRSVNLAGVVPREVASPSTIITAPAGTELTLIVTSVSVTAAAALIRGTVVAGTGVTGLTVVLTITAAGFRGRAETNPADRRQNRRTTQTIRITASFG